MGRVRSISRDAVAHERLGWVFTARIALDAQELRTESARYAISSGMRTTAEIHTGTQTLMQYLLAPVLGRIDEAARER